MFLDLTPKRKRGLEGLLPWPSLAQDLSPLISALRGGPGIRNIERITVRNALNENFCSLLASPLARRPSMTNPFPPPVGQWINVPIFPRFFAF